MWIKKVPEDGIVVTFDLPQRVEHVQIKSVVEPRPGRWPHHVVIVKESDFNENVKEWLHEAYVAALNR